MKRAGMVATSKTPVQMLFKFKSADDVSTAVVF
jgi:hypothetical protein